jgi:hypothetical protein
MPYWPTQRAWYYFSIAPMKVPAFAERHNAKRACSQVLGRPQKRSELVHAHPRMCRHG